MPADYENSFPGTGPFKLEKFTPKVGATFVRNPDYWGQSPRCRTRLEFSFYGDMQAQMLALQGGQLDILQQVPFKGSQALFSDPDLEVISLKSVSHQQVHMRTDMAPFTDKRVRRALALSSIARRSWPGCSMAARPSATTARSRPCSPRPMPRFRSASKTSSEAKQLMEAAGAREGL